MRGNAGIWLGGRVALPGGETVRQMVFKGSGGAGEREILCRARDDPEMPGRTDSCSGWGGRTAERRPGGVDRAGADRKMSSIPY